MKEIDTKNRTRYWWYIIFDYISILLDKKSYEKVLIYDTSQKNFLSSKPLHIWFEIVDGLIKIYDGIRYSVLIVPESYDTIIIGLDIL